MGDEEDPADDSDDEVDLTVEESDAAMVDEAVADLEYSDRVPQLSLADSKLGQFSIAKASTLIDFAFSY